MISRISHQKDAYVLQRILLHVINKNILSVWLFFSFSSRSRATAIFPLEESYFFPKPTLLEGIVFVSTKSLLHIEFRFAFACISKVTEKASF